MVFDQPCRVQSPALSTHHYLVRPSFSVPLAVLGQGGGGYVMWCHLIINQPVNQTMGTINTPFFNRFTTNNRIVLQHAHLHSNILIQNYSKAGDSRTIIRIVRSKGHRKKVAWISTTSDQGANTLLLNHSRMVGFPTTLCA